MAQEIMSWEFVPENVFEVPAGHMSADNGRQWRIKIDWKRRQELLGQIWDGVKRVGVKGFLGSFGG